MQNTLDKKRDITVDLFRLIASILVVLIHTTPGQNVPILYFISVTVGRYAVPFFMIVTGYYYFLNPSKEKLNKIISNIISLWIIWILIYLPNGIHTLIEYHNLKEAILRIIWSFIGESVCFGGSWYLIALAFGMLVVDYFRRKNKMWICNILAIISWIIDCMSTNYKYIFSNLGILNKMYWSTTIITGILWVTVAFYIAKNHIKLKKYGNTCFLILAIILTLIERMIIQYLGVNNDLIRTDMYITLPISVTLLFAFILQHSKLRPIKQVMIYRNLATLIYFVQFGVLMIVKLSGVYEFIGVLAITILISICIIIISKKVKWLKKLYI